MGGAGSGGEVWNWAGEVVVVLKPCIRRLGAELLMVVRFRVPWGELVWEMGESIVLLFQETVVVPSFGLTWKWCFGQRCSAQLMDGPHTGLGRCHDGDDFQLMNKMYTNLRTIKLEGIVEDRREE